MDNYGPQRRNLNILVSNLSTVHVRFLVNGRFRGRLPFMKYAENIYDPKRINLLDFNVTCPFLQATQRELLAAKQ